MKIRSGAARLRIKTLVAVLALCGTTLSMDRQAEAWNVTISQCGEASWYGGKWAGRPTANGEIYDPQTMTAAHKTLPFGTRVRVTRAGHARSVVVRINNRGPFIKGRVIDLSEKAADALAFKGNGIARVCLETIKT